MPTSPEISSKIKTTFFSTLFFSWNIDQLKYEKALNLNPIDGLSGTASPYPIIYNVPGTALLSVILGVTADILIERETGMDIDYLIVTGYGGYCGS